MFRDMMEEANQMAAIVAPKRRHCPPRRGTAAANTRRIISRITVFLPQRVLERGEMGSQLNSPRRKIGTRVELTGETPAHRPPAPHRLIQPWYQFSQFSSSPVNSTLVPILSAEFPGYAGRRRGRSGRLWRVLLIHRPRS